MNPTVDESRDAQSGARGEDAGQQAAKDAAPGDVDPLRALMLQAAELSEFVRHFAVARLDALRIGIRNRLLWLFVFLGCCLIGTAAAIIAMVYLIDGLSQGLTLALGGSEWGGRFLGGLSVLILLSVGVITTILWARSGSRSETAAKYEARRRKQRAKYGHDVRNGRNGDDGA